MPVDSGSVCLTICTSSNFVVDCYIVVHWVSSLHSLSLWYVCSVIVEPLDAQCVNSTRSLKCTTGNGREACTSQLTFAHTYILVSHIMWLVQSASQKNSLLVELCSKEHPGKSRPAQNHLGLQSTHGQFRLPNFTLSLPLAATDEYVCCPPFCPALFEQVWFNLELVLLLAVSSLAPSFLPCKKFAKNREEEGLVSADAWATSQYSNVGKAPSITCNGDTSQAAPAKRTTTAINGAMKRQALIVTRAEVRVRLC